MAMAKRLVLLSLSCPIPALASSDVEVVDFDQCTRQCRFYNDFFDRSITGVAKGILGNTCECHDAAGQVIGEAVPRTSTKPWDDSYWCDDFATANVCVNAGGMSPPRTTTRGDVKSGETVLHCGACGACSDLHDMEVIYNTRHTITTDMSRCAAEFAKPKIFGGDPSMSDLRKCLVEKGIDFTTDGRAWAQPQGRPTCMDCWTDNIESDAVNCKMDFDCIKKFFNPNNTGAYAGCLKCDEEKSGPEFIKCAGANRRSTGIVSDIQREGEQICKIGYYSNRTVVVV